MTDDIVPCAPRTNRLKELLSPVSCSRPPSLKTRTPSMPEVRERHSSSVSTMDQMDSGITRCIPLKTKRDAHVSMQTIADKTAARTTPQKHRKHKEVTSERSSTKDQTYPLSLRSSSSVGHRSSSRKCPATHAPNLTRTHSECDKEQRTKRNKAACIIQRAWRRLVYICCCVCLLSS